MKYNKLFIVGSPRSGTHWVRRLVALHPGYINNDYESSIFKVILGPFIFSRLFYNRRWKTVIKNYHHSHLHQWIESERFVKLLHEVRKLNGSKEAQAYHLIRRILDAYFQKQGGSPDQTLVEKTPDHIFYADRILDYFPEAKIVEVVRDVHEVYSSLERLDQKGASWVPSRPRNKIKLWTKAVAKGLALKSQPQYVNRWLTVRYEDLMHDTVGTVSSIFEFNHTPLSQESIRVSLDSEWTKAKAPRAVNLESNTVKLIKIYAGDLMVALGYNPQPN